MRTVRVPSTYPNVYLPPCLPRVSLLSVEGAETTLRQHSESNVHNNDNNNNYSFLLSKLKASACLSGLQHHALLGKITDRALGSDKVKVIDHLLPQT
jgi:hypothetical protein